MIVYTKRDVHRSKDIRDSQRGLMAFIMAERTDDHPITHWARVWTVTREIADINREPRRRGEVLFAHERTR